MCIVIVFLNSHVTVKTGFNPLIFIVGCEEQIPASALVKRKIGIKASCLQKLIIWYRATPRTPEQHFILKNDQILSITSIYNLRLKHVKMLVSYDTCDT